MALKVGDLAAFLTLDADQYEAGLHQAKAMAQAMPDADIEVDVDDAVARGQLQQVAAVAQAMPDANMDVDADTGAAMAKLTALGAMFKGLGVKANAGVTSSGKGFIRLATSIGAAGVAAAGFLATLGAVGFVGVKTNATLETATLQFETLMGSADEAEDHVRGLFDFAARTPFETEPIIEASRIMETFGGDLLNTKDNLTLFGDAAAATTQPINEVAFWMSRAYADIQAGRPFGEAAARLSEMGVITPQVRSKLEDLQASGAAGPAVWDELTGSLGRFSGAMEKQAGTWAGIKSSLMDMFSIGASEMTAPMFESLKGLGQAILDFSTTPGWDAILARGTEVFGGIAVFIDKVTEAVRSGDFSEVLATMGDMLGDAGTAVTDALIGGFERILPLIPEYLLRIVQAVANMDWGPMSEAMTFGLIAMLMAVNWTELTAQAVSLLIAIVPDIIDGFVSGIIRAATENPLDFALLFISLGFIPAKVLGVLAGVLGKIPILGKFLEWILKAIGGAAQAVLGPAREKLMQVGGAAMKGLMGGLDNGWGAVKGWVGKIPSMIGNLFGGAGRWLFNAGKAIINGLRDGIASAFGAVKAKLSELTSFLPDWKGPPIRDAKLLFGAGQTVIGGFVAGLESQFGSVKATLNSLTSNLSVPTPAGAGAAGGGGWSGDIVVQGSVVTERDLARTIDKVLTQRGYSGGRI